MLRLKFSPGHDNAKLAKLEKRLKKKVYTFSLMSGHTCPYAKDCHSKAVSIRNGEETEIFDIAGETFIIKDGPHTQFRCFSASQDVLFPALRQQREYNGQILEVAGRSVMQAANIILESLPINAKVVRIHVGGDFKTQAYFDAWHYVAQLRPDITFYAYTKSLPFWVKRINDIPNNFHLTASHGGYRDDLIDKYNLRFAKVVFSKAEAKQLGLTIDHDDSHAAKPGPSFALLLHGTQPKGSEAATALKKLRKIKAVA